MAQSDVRRYEVRAASTDVFGRVMCSVRNHHYVIDGPEQNGCPGEEVTPGELFLSAVAACGVRGTSSAWNSSRNQWMDGPFQSGAFGCVSVQLREPPLPVARCHRR